MEKKRNGEIDVLRFIIATILVIYHLCQIFKLKYVNRGNIGVEFFFVVSGYLMAAHAKRVLTKAPTLPSGTEIANETWKFIGGKVKSYFKYFLFALIMQTILIDGMLKHITFTALCRKLLTAIPALTQTVIGLNYSSSVLYLSGSWYLSAMIIAMFLLYPLLLKKYESATKYYFPLISMFVLGYLYTKYGECSIWEKWDVICFTGILRGLSEVALGGFLFEVANYVASRYEWLLSSEKVGCKVFLTIIKLVCYTIFFLYAQGSHFKKDFSLYALLFVSIGVMLSFLNAGYTIPESRLTRFLGKISLPIYLYHGMFKNYFGHLLDPKVVSLSVLCALTIGIILIAIIFYFFVNFASKIINKGFQKIKEHASVEET